jgi:hypothetical protein
MAANTEPIYPRTPQIEWCPTVITAANTAKDGTGTVNTVFTADATEGSYLKELVIKTAGTNIATVMRIFINNGSSNATPANNILYKELTLIATTISETTSQSDVVIPMDLALPPGYVINVVLGTAVAAGYYVTGNGGKY